MDDGQHAGRRIDQGHGQAVGHHDGQRDLAVRRDEHVGVGDRVVLAARPPAALGRAHHSGVRAVHLAGEDHVLESGAEGGCGAGPVLEHVLGPVAHVQGQVQRVVGRGRDAAGPGGHRDVRAERRRRPEAHQGQGRRGGHGHRPYRGAPDPAPRPFPTDAQEA